MFDSHQVSMRGRCVVASAPSRWVCRKWSNTHPTHASVSVGTDKQEWVNMPGVPRTPSSRLATHVCASCVRLCLCLYLSVYVGECVCVSVCCLYLSICMSVYVSSRWRMSSLGLSLGHWIGALGIFSRLQQLVLVLKAVRRARNRTSIALVGLAAARCCPSMFERDLRPTLHPSLRDRGPSGARACAGLRSPPLLFCVVCSWSDVCLVCRASGSKSHVSPCVLV